MSAILSGEQTEGLLRLAEAVFKDRFESELGLREQRISQLERINAALAEECDRLRREHAKTDQRLT